MMDNLNGYQSKETAWRYEAYRKDMIKEMRWLEEQHVLVRERLDALEAKPPMHHLFNWSA